MTGCHTTLTKEFPLLLCKLIFGLLAQLLRLTCSANKICSAERVSPSPAGDLLCWTVVCERQKRRQRVSPARLVP